MINEAIINIKEGFLVLDRLKIETSDSCKTNERQQQKFIEKTKIYIAQYDQEEKLENTALQIMQMVCNQKRQNPKLGNITLERHFIHTFEPYRTCKKQYPVPSSIWHDTKELLGYLAIKQIIRKSQATFYAPAFIIKKKKGSLRLVIDYRDLNKKQYQ